MKAGQIVDALLNGGPPPDDPERLFAQYASAIGQENAAKEADILRQFKRQAAGYIRWINPDFTQADLRSLRSAHTFAEAEAVLARYDSDPSFLSMVRQGYF